MKKVFATEVASYSICGKTFQDLLSQLEEQEQSVGKADDLAVQVAQELVKQGVELSGGSGGKGEAAVVAEIARSLSEGHGTGPYGRRRPFVEVVESAVEVLKSQRQRGATVDHDAMTVSEGGKPVIQVGDQHSQAVERKTKMVRRRPKGGGRSR